MVEIEQNPMINGEKHNTAMNFLSLPEIQERKPDILGHTDSHWPRGINLISRNS